MRVRVRVRVMSATFCANASDVAPSWEEGVSSKVVITIEEKEPGDTHVRLEQTGLPEADKFGNEDVYDNTQRGWKENVFGRIRSVFGYGI